MSDLTDFLLARIAETKALASTHRYLIAECDAKRRIVEEARDSLRLLALPYTDHPDYREEWRP